MTLRESVHKTTQKRTIHQYNKNACIKLTFPIAVVAMSIDGCPILCRLTPLCRCHVDVNGKMRMDATLRLISFAGFTVMWRQSD